MNLINLFGVWVILNGNVTFETNTYPTGECYLRLGQYHGQQIKRPCDEVIEEIKRQTTKGDK